MKKDMPQPRKSPETGRRSRDLISGMRILVSSDDTSPTVRTWATKWLLYLEGFTEDHPGPQQPKEPVVVTPIEIQEVAEGLSPEEERLRELIKEQEDGTNTQQ